MSRQARATDRDDCAGAHHGIGWGGRCCVDFVEQELELKTNTDITREIHTLTTELHRRLIPDEDVADPRDPGA